MTQVMKKTRTLVRGAILVLFWLFPAAAVLAGDRFTLSNEGWSAGAIPEGSIVEKKITVANGGRDELRLDITSDTHRLSAEPTTLRLAPGETASVALLFDTTGSTGEFSHKLNFRALDGANEEKAFPVEGKVDSTAAIAQLNFFFYYAFNCHECQEFLDITVPELERKLGVKLSVLQRDVLVPAHLTLFKRKVKQLGQRATDLPAVIIGDTVLQGKERINRELEPVLREYAAKTRRGSAVVTAPGPDAAGPDDALTIIPVALAGLLDGINPCVFSTLIFLLAYLAYVGRTKKQILLIGIVYSATVFVTYFLIGLGFFRVIQAMSAFPVVALIIQIVLMIVLLVFGVLSVHDFIKIRQNKVKDVKLQLPDRFKERIRKTIRTQAASVTIVASSIVVAFLVTLFELVCTGQIYLPTITALAQTRRSISDFLYLGIYNLAFVTPLALVFFLTYRGLTSQKLTAFFQKHMAIVKLVTAGLFFGLVILVAVLNAPLIFSYVTKYIVK